MWHVTSAFEQAIVSPVHRIAVRVDILDTDFNVIAGGTFTTTSNIVDGSVDVDVTRANRRTFQMNLLNNEAQFSPGTDLGGLFYVDRIIRLWRGVTYGDGHTEFVPIGTFMIDTADVVIERNMSIVTLAGQDLWKKFAKSQFVSPKTYAEGTFINDVIKDMANHCGVDKMTLDPLLDRSSNQKNLNVARSYEVGDFRGQELVTLCADYSLDIFFDPTGRLVTREIEDPSKKPIVWTFTPGQSSVLSQLQATYQDEGLYNHVVVVGSGDETVSYRTNVKDIDPLSPVNINRVGDRVYRYESGVLATQQSVDKAAISLFHKKRATTENIRLEAVCNPAFEGGDVVRVKEDNYTGINQRYALSQFNIPLSTSKQTLHMTRAVSLFQSSTQTPVSSISGTAGPPLASIVFMPISVSAITDTPTITHTFSGDGTGSTDVSSALQSFLDGVPDGAVIGFSTPNGIYNIGDASIVLDDRNDLTFVGNGATIYQTTLVDVPILVFNHGGSNIVMYDLHVKGSNPNPGEWDFDFEHNHGVQVWGVQGFEASGCNVTNVGGDGLYLSNAGSGHDNEWANGVRWHHGIFDGIGRMGVSVTDGAQNVVIDFNTFRNIGYYTWDVEPNGIVYAAGPAGGAHLRYSDNTIEVNPFGRYPFLSDQPAGAVFVATGASGGGPCNDVEITRNTMTDTEIGAFKVLVFDNGVDVSNIVVSYNVGAVAFNEGPDAYGEGIGEPWDSCMGFNSVAGLTVFENTQPVVAGATFETHTGSTSVSIHDNHTDP